jgi:hypothetical protein
MIADFDKARQGGVGRALAGKVYSEGRAEMVLKYRDEFRAKHPAK